MKIALEIERRLRVSAPQGAAPLADLEATLGLFPKLRKLKALGPGRYQVELKPIGSKVANIAHEVAFAAEYRFDAARGQLQWTPFAGSGNASLSGTLRLDGSGESANLSLKVQGELADVPVPLLYRPVAPAFIRGKFAALVDAYLERLAERLAHTAPAKSSRGRTSAA